MTSRLILLDNTVLTNFALVGRPDLVLDLWAQIVPPRRRLWQNLDDKRNLQTLLQQMRPTPPS